ncbi:MAG: small basic family protein [Bacillota bacterium]|nr:small basic family protein [Bacillota bacterium]
MIFVIIFVIVGISIGLAIPLQFFAISSFYVSVGILAAIDSIVGALKASYDEEFDLAIFATGLLINTLMAMALSWVGDKIGVPLYYAAVFVFGTRLFNNLALIRRRVIERIRKNRLERKRLEAGHKTEEVIPETPSEADNFTTPSHTK